MVTKSELAMIAEWAFSHGQLKSEAQLMTLSLKVFLALNKNQVLGPKRLARASVAIYQDLLPIYRKLSYGGRSSSEISENRVAQLHRWISNGQFSRLAA